ALGGTDTEVPPPESGGTAPPASAAAAALTDLTTGVREAVAGLLDDDDPEPRAATLRILATAGDARVTVARVVRAAAVGPAAPRSAAVFAARRWAASHATNLPGLTMGLGAALAETRSWDGRLGVVVTLAALGEPGIPMLELALRDDSPLV